MNNGPRSHTLFDDPRCGVCWKKWNSRIGEDCRGTWVETLAACPVCVGTDREPIPWTEVMSK